MTIHRWTGLIATPFFLILCLTGSVLIFHEEVDRLLGDAPPNASAPLHALSLGQLAAAARTQMPGRAVQTIFISEDEPDRAFVGMIEPGQTRFEDARPLFLDRASGRPLAISDPDATFTGFLLKLHARWFAGVPGELFGSAIAVLIFICLVTGVAIYAPYVRKLAFGMIRRDRGRRIVQLDLHNLVGVVVLGWLSIVTFTGICLGLGSVLLGVWQSTELRAMAGADRTRPAAMVSVDVAAAAANAATPDRELHFAFWPNTDFSSPRHFTFLMYGRHSYDKHLFDVVLVDAGTGRVAAARSLPWYLKIVVLSGPLHFGNYGGLALKLLWLASAWGALFITGNGAWLWWSRNRRRTSSLGLDENLAQ